MPRFLLRLAYDGTDYAGWQRQDNGLSVQAVLEEALAPLSGAPVTAVGAGRTDAGVHAEGQAAHVDLPEGLTEDVVLRAANARLPADVRVRSATRVSEDVHARFSTIAKTYRYTWLVSRVGHPMLARTACLVPPRLDLVAMGRAAACLEGRHDFAAFQSTGTPVTSTERTIFGADLCVRPGDDLPLTLLDDERLIELEITGDGFLRHMVRAIAGTLLEVAQGRRTADDLPRLLAGASRSEAGPKAPAHGLTLLRVLYANTG